MTMNTGSSSSSGRSCLVVNRITSLLLVMVVLETSWMFLGDGDSFKYPQLNLSVFQQPSQVDCDASVKKSSSISSSPTSVTGQSGSRPPPLSKVGLCALTKDSERYLDEWVDYNLFAIEFHEIYLYDNSEDFYLEEWAEKREREHPGRMHIHHYPGRNMQQKIYNNCTATYGDRVDYLAYFDDDEFFHAYEYTRVGDFVPNHLRNGSSLTINWRVMGTSNHTHYFPLPVTKRYTYRNVTDVTVKSFVRPQDYSRMLNPHAVVLNGYLKEDRHKGWRDTSGNIGNFNGPGSKNSNPKDDIAVLYHYKYKSNREWDDKSCNRMNPGKRANVSCGEVPMVGHIFDDTIWQVLKKRLPHKYGPLDQWLDFS